MFALAHAAKLALRSYGTRTPFGRSRQARASIVAHPKKRRSGAIKFADADFAATAGAARRSRSFTWPAMRALMRLASCAVAAAMRPPPALVTFDCTGTLFDTRSSVGFQYKAAVVDVSRRKGGFKAASAALDESALDAAFGGAYGKASTARPNFGAGVCSSYDWWRAVVEETFSGAGLPADACEALLPDAFEELFHQTFVTRKGWHLTPHAARVLAELDAARGDAGAMNVGVISNWDERLPLLLADLEVDQHIDFVLTSRAAGVEKPDTTIFDLARERCGLPPDARMVHIGDSWGKDCVGAVAAGWEAVFVCPPERLAKLDAATRASMAATPHVYLESLDGLAGALQQPEEESALV